jgi:hypothetical protein
VASCNGTTNVFAQPEIGARVPRSTPHFTDVLHKPKAASYSLTPLTKAFVAIAEGIVSGA